MSLNDLTGAYPERAAERDRWILARRPPRDAVDPWHPNAFLLEEERAESGEIVSVATIFLTNRECPWHCLMCDLWKNTVTESVAPGAIPAQIDYALAELRKRRSAGSEAASPADIPIAGSDRGQGHALGSLVRMPALRQIKLYNSGSFFDPRAIPPEDHAAIAQRVAAFERVIVECHPALVGEPGLKFRDLIETGGGGRPAHGGVIRGGITQRHAGSGLPAAPLRSAAQAGDPAYNAVGRVPSRGGIYGAMYNPCVPGPTPDPSQEGNVSGASAAGLSSSGKAERGFVAAMAQRASPDSADVGGCGKKLEVAMGLETAHPRVLEKLNKRMTLDQFRRAAEFLRRNDIALRVFVLVKPPFLDEAESLVWAKRSVDFAFDCGAAVVSLIPTRIGNGALEALARRGEFSAPKLATLEAAVDYGVGLKRGRVFADLWDLEKFSDCETCFAQRRARLQEMNLRQIAQPPAGCDRCRERAG